MKGKLGIGYIGVALALWLAPLLVSAQVAQGSSGFSDADLAMLPPYCQAKLAGNQAAQQLWAQRAGKNWPHIHHHCYGLNYLNQARMEFSNEKHKRFLLRAAVRNFEYVLTRWPAGTPLFQEAQASQLEAQSMLQLLR